MANEKRSFSVLHCRAASYLREAKIAKGEQIIAVLVWKKLHDFIKCKVKLYLYGCNYGKITLFYTLKGIIKVCKTHVCL